MKKIIFALIAFAFLQNVSAQLKVNASGLIGIGTENPEYKLDVSGDVRVTGDIYLGSQATLLGTNSNVPIKFKVDNVLAGSTGSASNANVSFGYQALTTLAGSGNVAIGAGALYFSTGNANTANGYQALYSNTIGGNNTANGYQAMFSNTTGYNNTASGVQALFSNTTGICNTASGYQALYKNTDGQFNIANGFQTLYNNTTGSYNIAGGHYALYNNTTGNNNTAYGNATLINNTTGSGNTAFGVSALFSNTTGENNAANGIGALINNSTGHYNTASGFYSLANNTTGSYNTAIGCWASVNSNDLTNATALGSYAFATASNQVRIGNSYVTSIGGFAAWSNFSDGRAKRNIRQNVPGLAFINRLQPVTYNLDLDAVDELMKIDRTDSLSRSMPQYLQDINNRAREAKQKQVQTGFVAQDVEAVAKSIGFEFSGLDVDESGIYGLRYAEFVVPLVKAVQELSEQNEKLQKQVDELTGLVNQLLGKKQ